MPEVANLTGVPFGRLTAQVHLRRGRRIYWECTCTCGVRKTVRADHLISGKIQSCGCYHDEVAGQATLTHGKTNSKAYAVHEAMMQRCYNKKDAAYPRYGGRGIIVSRRWHFFENFYTDMGDPPPGMTLERSDNDMPYAKGNCKWATRKEQANNTSRNRIIEFNGEVRTLTQWAECTGIKPSTITRRLTKLGWSVKEALTTPARAWGSI